jgi:hypothetical protein
MTAVLIGLIQSATGNPAHARAHDRGIHFGRAGRGWTGICLLGAKG